MAEMKIQQRETNPENVSERPTVSPRVDVYESEKEILLIADLPGVAKEQLNVRVDGDTLVLEGSRVFDVKGSLLAAEYRPIDYRRTFNVPPGIDRSKIDAELHAGVLKLHLPKEAALQPRRIAIRSA